MGGNLWRKWLGESDEPGRNRVQAFVYSRLWMGVFPSFLAGFAVIFLICYWGNLPVEKSSNKALLSGLLCVVGYAQQGFGAVLGRLSFIFTSGRDIGNVGKVDIQTVVPPQFGTKLTNGFKKR